METGPCPAAVRLKRKTDFSVRTDAVTAFIQGVKWFENAGNGLSSNSQEHAVESDREIVSVQMADGATIYIEATLLGGREDVGIRDLSFQGVTDSIKSIAREINEVLTEVGPRKAVVEFGLEIGMESGQLTALLVKGKGTATLKVTLEWESQA